MLVKYQPTSHFRENEKGHHRHAHIQSALVDMFEVLPASSSAWIMSTYMSQLRPGTRPPDAVCLRTNYHAIEANSRLSQLQHYIADLDFLIQPSQWLALAACLVFGCSAASFLHRRKTRDFNQPYIFAICVSVGAVVGQFSGASADYIMLVYVSWAVCVSMLASVVCLAICG